MKIKEIPKSLMRMTSLLITPVAQLGAGAKKSDIEVVISLTTIQYRLPRLHLVVRSLLHQTVRFKKIILWVNEGLKSDIPTSLNSLQSDRFEIRFSEGHSSHRKLIETLKIHPQEHIVTCDDDVMYPRDWLERLLVENKHNPNAVIAHMCRVFRFDSHGLMPYRTWCSERLGESSDRTLPLGWGGVLYPPGSLHEDVMNESLYMTLAPKADDLWFKAMAYKNGTPVYKSRYPDPEPIPIMFTQKYSLKKVNIEEDRNREQWLNISKYYGIELNDI